MITSCNSKIRYIRILGRPLSKATLVLIGILSAAASPALAVDLVNRDRAPREVTVNAADGSSKVVTLKAGEKVANVCDDCVILVGNSSVEAKGRATVKIEGGEVSIASQR